MKYYVHTLYDKYTFDFDDMENKIYLNEIR